MNELYIARAKIKNWECYPKDEQWFYGYYVKGLDYYENIIHVIIEETSTLSTDRSQNGLWNEIDKDTLGSFTGYKDENQKGIFSGDIIAFEDVGEDGFEYKEGFDFTNYAEVYYDEDEARWSLRNFAEPDNSAVAAGEEEINRSFFEHCIVSGNIYDNPELLKDKAPLKEITEAEQDAAKAELEDFFDEFADPFR